MTTVDELQVIVAGHTAIAKQQAETQKTSNTQIANLTEALLAHGGPSTAPATAQVNFLPLLMPALQLPQFRYDQNTHDDVNEFLESFDVQTTHLQAATKLTLLQEACVGEWPNSMLSMEKTKFTDETTPLHKLERFKQALKSAFAEPPEVQRRRLASEFSTMKERVTESIDRFAFRSKKNLHLHLHLRLAKLGEPVYRNSPQFIMSQFISKTKPDIQKHLVLKAEEYKDLSEIIEAAKRIERSFSPSHSQPNKQSPEQTNALTTNPAPGFPRGRGKGPRCYSSYGYTKGNCPEKTQKNHNSTNPQRSNEVCRLWNKHQRPPCVLPDQSCRYGRLHNYNTCSKPGCKDIHMQTLVNLLQTPAKFNHHRQPNWDHALLNHLPLVFSLSLPTLRYF